MKINVIYLLDVTNKHESIWSKIADPRIWESNKQKPLEVHIDRTLSLVERISNLCKKTGRKLSVLAKSSSYMTLTQRRVLMKSFIEAQFVYCPLVWMFHGRALNRTINHLQEPSLRIVYKDSVSSFHELLQKDHSFIIHHRNIQSLAIELYKIKEYLSNEIMSSISPPRLIKYNLQTQSDIFRNSVNNSKYGLKSIRFFASKVWQIAPMEMKNLKSLEDFKTKIREWEPDGCDCKLCKDIVPSLVCVSLV